VANERKTEKLVRDTLAALGYESAGHITLDEQKSDNPKINKLLKSASKAGHGAGRPEFIVTSSEHPDLILIIECKASVKNHRSPVLDRPVEFACDGALLYASYLSKEYDVIAIGVSGEKASELLVSHFVHLRNQPTAFPISPLKLLSFSDIYTQYIQSPEKFNIDYANLLAYSQELNRTLHRLKIKESQRSLLISSILIALKNNAFIVSYRKHKNPTNLSTSLVKTVTDELNSSDIPKDKVSNLTHAYSFIQTHTTLTKDPVALVDLISEVDKRVNGFMNSHRYFDTLGQFYIEFLRYANNDKGLGIVLTPPHMTELFADLAEVTKDSIVLDSCCGTGGFLISAMKKMVAACDGDSSLIEKVKKTQLIGIEVQHDIYALAISNMILQDDGKSSIVSGSCFDLVTQMKNKKASVGLLNPPYKAEKEDVDELAYVLNNLEMLSPGGVCVALVPISCMITQEGVNIALKSAILKKHTLLAVMSLPEDLFHNSKVGVVTCAVVLKAHVSHGNKKTWLAYWRNDGFSKQKGRGRVDKDHRWASIRDGWLTAYEGRTVDAASSLLAALTPEDEWCVEAYMKVDYSHIDRVALAQEMRRYMAYEILSEDVT